MAAFSYSYRVNGLQKAPAEVAGAICQQLQDSEQGLSPATLLEASRDPSAPLHNEFIWDNDEAAERYRLSQARSIIQNIVISVKRMDGSEVKDRQFVSAPGGKGQYVSLQSALGKEEWTAHLLKQAEDELRSFEAKYRRLNELAGVNAAIEDFLKRNVG